MITTNLYCESLEFLVHVDPECVRLAQVGDLVKYSMRLDDAEAHRRLERLADSEVVTLYRNAVWIKFEVKRREFFVSEWGEPRSPLTATLYVEPLTRNALDALKIVIEARRRTDGS